MNNQDLQEALKEAKEQTKIKNKIKASGVSEKELNTAIFWIKVEKHKQGDKTATPLDYIQYINSKLKDKFKEVL